MPQPIPQPQDPTLRLCTAEEAKAFTQRLREANIALLRFEAADMAGLSRGKTVPTPHVANYLQTGLNFYGGALAVDTASIPAAGSGYHAERNYADAVLVPDLDTLTPIPWLERTSRVICDTMWYDTHPQMAAPRLLLKCILNLAASLGLAVKMGHEYEFYVVDAETRQPLFTGQPIFVSHRNHQSAAIDRLLLVLQAQGVDIITHNVEYGPGQFEINFAALTGIAAADRAFVFKNTVKEYLAREGLLATFMTKPYKGRSGSCSHFHVSLLDAETGRNIFLDTADPDGLSARARSFIQGVLDHARAAMAVWNPTPNCYRRIRPRTYAPSNISWGIQDRTASIRVKASRDEQTHVEVRTPGALSNPYLVAAVTLAAGLLGIVQQRPLAPAGEGPKEEDSDYAKLPLSLEESLAAFERDEALTTLLGPEFVQVFLAMKRQEAARLRDEIPAAETAEYFELY